MSTTTARTGNRGTLQTVDRALDVLEYMAQATEPQSLAALSHEFDRSKATMHRILKSLRKRGYLVQDSDTGFYRFGWACSRLTDLAKQGISLTELCLPYMRELRRRTEETVYLTLYQEGRAVAIESLLSPKPVVATSVLGQVLPLYAVSGSLAVLAFQPDAVVERVLRGPLFCFTPRTVTDPEKIRATIRKIRRDGYAVNRESFRPGVSGIAAPVRMSQDGPVVAAISVCMPSARFDLELKKEVLWAANATSNALASYAGGHSQDEDVPREFDCANDRAVVTASPGNP